MVIATMKRKGMESEVLVWIILFLLMTLVVLVIIFRGNFTMQDIVEKVFGFIRFGP